MNLSLKEGRNERNSGCVMNLGGLMEENCVVGLATVEKKVDIKSAGQ